MQQVELPTLEPPIIIKFGGSVITKKDQEFTVKENVIRRLADELASAGKPAIVIHGAGSYGHTVAKKYHLAYGTKEPMQFRMFSFLRTQMDELRTLVSTALYDAGLNPFPIQPSAIFTTMEGKIFHFADHTLLQALRLGYTPVLHGDGALDFKWGSSIISGDVIAELLAKYLGPTKVIFVSDVDGIYDKDPKLFEDATLLEHLTIGDVLRLLKSESVGESTYDDVTQGMKGKLKAILPIIDSQCEVVLINGMREGTLYNVLVGTEERGTYIKPK